MTDNSNSADSETQSQSGSQGPVKALSRRRAGRRRGLGEIRLRGRIFWIGYSFHGKVYRESSRSTERRDAVLLLRKRLGEVGRGKLIGPDAEKVTFDDLQQLVLTDYRVNGRKSVRRAEIAFQRLEQFFGLYRALEITPDRIKAYIEVRQRAGRKAATIQYELALLKRGFTLAFEAGKLPNRPHVPSVEVRNTRQGFFEAAECQELLKHLPAYLTGFVEFLYLTGWRLGEVLTLRWAQVDFQAGVVRLEPGTTKNDEGRSFPFAVLPRLEAVLRQQRELTTKREREIGQIVPLVFHRGGQPLGDLRGPWKTAVTAIGLPTRIMHDFRRTAVRNLERAGVPRSVAMKLTGHKTESVYRRYAIVNEADLREGVTKLAKLHESQPGSAAPAVVPLSDRKRPSSAMLARPSRKGALGA
jgi:integrase